MSFREFLYVIEMSVDEILAECGRDFAEWE
jgi:hypothetical protein